MRGVAGARLPATTPRVTVVMPLYDKEGLVRRAVASVLAQTFTAFAVVVVDDGSTDRGPDEVRAVGDARIRVVSQPNAGAAAARNRGVAEAGTELVAFLDADDEWLPGYLEAIVGLVERYPACAVFATGYRIAGAEGLGRVARLRGFAAGEGVLEDYFRVAAVSDPPLWTGAVAVRKRALDAVGGFPAGVVSGEDLLTWARLASRYPIAYHREPQAVFHAPASAHDRPGRAAADADEVGEGLLALAREADPARRADILAYRSLWYRMRAATALQAGDAPRARRLARRALRHGVGVRALLFNALLLLPGNLAAAVYGAARGRSRRALSRRGGGS